MTKKEINSIKLKAIFNAIKHNASLNVLEDFEDVEGHGYFTGYFMFKEIDFAIDLQRRDFSIIVYEADHATFNQAIADELEELLQIEIEDALAQAENQIQSMQINKGLGLA